MGRGSDKRNILHVGLRSLPGRAEITPAMVEAVRRRIEEGGGTITVWAVLQEDRYETKFGDGFYLYIRGVALNEADAKRLAALDRSDPEYTAWHVRSCTLGLENNVPVFLDKPLFGDEFTMTDFVETLSEIGPDETASKLEIGSGWEGRKPGSHLLALK